MQIVDSAKFLGVTIAPGKLQHFIERLHLLFLMHGKLTKVNMIKENASNEEEKFTTCRRNIISLRF